MSLDPDRGRRLAKLLATELLALEERIKEETQTLARRRDCLLSYVARVNAFDTKAAAAPDAAAAAAASPATNPAVDYEIRESLARSLYSVFQLCIRRDSMEPFVLKSAPLPDPFDEAKFNDEYRGTIF